MNVLEKVIAKMSKRKTDAAADYRAAVIQLADGHEPDADQLAKVLERSSKTPGDLRDAVASLIERRRLRAVLDAKPKAEKRIAEIDAATGKIEAKREAFDQKCDGERAPLDDEHERLQTTVAAAGDAERALYRGCADPQVLNRSEAITNEIEQILAEVQQLQNERHRFSAAAVGENETARNVMSLDGYRVEAAENLKTYAAKCVELDAQIAELEARLPALKEESAKLDARRLEP